MGIRVLLLLFAHNEIYQIVFYGIDEIFRSNVVNAVITQRQCTNDVGSVVFQHISEIFHTSSADLIVIQVYCHNDL